VKDVIVIGAGIIGATIAKAFTAKGREVLLMDANLSMPGTAPSGGHMRPQWFGNLKTGYEPAMGIAGPDLGGDRRGVPRLPRQEPSAAQGEWASREARWCTG
jgi:glycine/D-amino acid oxidase-like deaminating enzyme